SAVFLSTPMNAASETRYCWTAAFVVRRRLPVDTRCAILARQLVRISEPFLVEVVIQRGKRHLWIVPRQLGYPSLFRGHVFGLQGALRVSQRRVCHCGAPLPSIGSPRARFPDVSSTTRALRLPTSNTHSLMASLVSSTRRSLICVRFRAPSSGERTRRPGLFL